MNSHVELSGGESVYCINEAQLSKARELAVESGAGEAIQTFLSEIESSLSRNARAALAFLLIDNLVRQEKGA